MYTNLYYTTRMLYTYICIGQAKANSFDKVDAIDTIVREGEILYIPSYWLHYIISLQYSIQCNSRSGSPPKDQGAADIMKCMGALPNPGRKAKRAKLRGK